MEELLSKATRAGVRFAVEGNELRVTAPQGALSEELRQGVRKYKGDILKLLLAGAAIDEPLPLIEPDQSHRYEPFPLTDLQHAYWLGRDNSLDMGGVATHLYVELDCHDLDLAQLNASLRELIEQHDMLRAVVNPDGMQQVLRVVPEYQIAVQDLSLANAAEIDSAVESVRQDLSHQVFKPDRWPLFEVRATQLPSRRLRLHVSLDLLIFDAWSIFLFFKEWQQRYERRGDVHVPINITFRDYVLAAKPRVESLSYKKAHDFWMGRIDTLPPAPDLPLRSDSAARAKPRFVRREARLDKTRWNILRERGRALGLTPSGLLLAAYSEILARWSGSPHFTINVTVSNRLQLHEDVNRLLGDFTLLVMHEVDHQNPNQSFSEFATQLQKQFSTDLDHRELSGVSVLREWAKRRGIPLQAAMPVVFSSGLIWSGSEDVGDLEQFGKKVYSISQTSQVWLDHHVMELGGELVYIWDAAEDVFEAGVLDAMFSSYCDLIGRLADDQDLWKKRSVTTLPVEMARRREEMNRSTFPLARSMLHAGFVEQARRQPHATAVIAPNRSLSYAELLAESTAVADRLIERGLLPGGVVGVLMRKGWEQVVAVCGVLLARGAYLPVDADLPPMRQMELLRIGNVAHVLTQSGSTKDISAEATFEALEVTQGPGAKFREQHAQSVRGDDNELAYVIFTSGTTGAPKGVMIDHHGAMNTIKHVNRLFSVGNDDRVLAVSSLSFDLSVYDIFGLLDAGGSLVIPDAERGNDPVHWRELIVKHKATLWNSAPQLMRMLLDGFDDTVREELSLRTVFLSGDFISLDLPARIRSHYPRAEVSSLGGATEVSIWSIYYPIKRTEANWSSIPYGRPLPNQTVWVYDHAFRPCPDHVKGRIYIGGAGLAIGYWRDLEKTAAKFVTDPNNGERLYDTGDLGRYAPDGNILIIGREDGQIKIRGYRVEVGEIEAVLRKHSKVRYAAVVAAGESRENRQLAAYIELATGIMDVEANVQEIREFLKARLPDYMIPRYIVPVAHIPITSNGKIDYRALPEISETVFAESRLRIMPRNAEEQVIYDQWSRIISGSEIGVTDNFFELGGDSILATQLVREINMALPGLNLEMHELFENLTIESLAALAKTRASGDAPHAVTLVGDEPSPQAGEHHATTVMDAQLVADARNIANRFAELDFTPRHIEDNGEFDAALLTGATGWLGSYVLAELLQQTAQDVYCLVRATTAEEGVRRLFGALHQHGVSVDTAALHRIHVIVGDLCQPRLGLEAGAWTDLSAKIGSIYHCGASINVLADYLSHRKTNVDPIEDLVRFAVERRSKSLFAVSPMTVCRRRLGGKLVVLSDETSSVAPEGLLTGYAQSKWVAEKVFQSAQDRGLLVKIYRSSHALPPEHSGRGRQNDTYTSILQLAAKTPYIPDWDASSLYGVPVDKLARLLVEDSLVVSLQGGIVHIENSDPLSLKSIIEVLHQGGDAQYTGGVYVTLEEWKARCLETAKDLRGDGFSLARLLFSEKADGTAVENMFGKHLIKTDYFTSRGRSAKLAQLTPESYWRKVASHF